MYCRKKPEILTREVLFSARRTYFLLCIVCFASLTVTSCKVLERADPFAGYSTRDFYLHGKFGHICSTAVLPVGLGLDVALLPVTLPTAYCLRAFSTDMGTYVIFLPGAVLQFGVSACAASAALPVHVMGEVLPRSLHAAPKEKAEIVRHSVECMPYLSQEEYSALVVAAGRPNAPKYKSAGNAGPIIRFVLGMKPKLAESVVRDWRAWWKRQILKRRL